MPKVLPDMSVLGLDLNHKHNQTQQLQRPERAQHGEGPYKYRVRSDYPRPRAERFSSETTATGRRSVAAEEWLEKDCRDDTSLTSYDPQKLEVPRKSTGRRKSSRGGMVGKARATLGRNTGGMESVPDSVYHLGWQELEMFSTL